MGIPEARKAVLQYLFEGYQQNPNGVFEIGEVARTNELDPYEFLKYLVKNGWVKNQTYGGNHFSGQITTEGINEVDPSYLETEINKIVSTLGTVGDRQSAMQLLGYEPKDFPKAFDIVKYMETQTDWLDLPQYQHNDIYIKLSVSGQEYYEENKAIFM